jgi:hypothetical protein
MGAQGCSDGSDAPDTTELDTGSYALIPEKSIISMFQISMWIDDPILFGHYLHVSIPRHYTPQLWMTAT